MSGSLAEKLVNFKNTFVQVGHWGLRNLDDPFWAGNPVDHLERAVYSHYADEMEDVEEIVYSSMRMDLEMTGLLTTRMQGFWHTRARERDYEHAGFRFIPDTLPSGCTEDDEFWAKLRFD